ncbi:MAG: Gfo/Idh/MocA family oxidoreductase, partial [Acidobacteria bacterium]|nr:Gfo/Idh/MocA family oxidoreductase [Acidobacteriota bacterium]
ADCRLAAVCDVNQAGRERGVALVEKLANGAKPQQFEDMRAMFESKDIDAVSITTPNHWHALAAIRACQAGKDVYVEKPASHNIFEGNQMVAAARKYKRMVQVGSQSRTIAHKARAMQLLREGIIGQVYHARGLCYRRRFSIGHTPEEACRPGSIGTVFSVPRSIARFPRTALPTTGIGSGTQATATSATRAFMRWTSICGDSTAAAGRSRLSRRAASMCGRTTRKRPTRKPPNSILAMPPCRLKCATCPRPPKAAR